MRRITLVAPVRDEAGERELRDTSGWLRELPIASLTRVARLREVALDQTDVLWIGGLLEPDPLLTDWLRGGGRLFATQDAAGILSSQGLEPEWPAAVPLPDPLPPEFGLAGFGPHPFFAGLRDGAVLGPARWGQPARMTCYVGGTRPRAAAVVAVERRGFELREHTVLAWECAVGAGGVLCLAFDPGLRSERDTRGEAEVVLANALLGDAIPHRDRASPVTVWPAPGIRAAGRVEPGPMLVAPAEVWPETSQPLLDLVPGAAWTHAGRRVVVSARGAEGRRDVWAPPFRVMRDAFVHDAIPSAPAHLAADEIAGGLVVGGHRLLERWLAAADTPLAVWEIGGPPGIAIVAEWTVDLRRAWPYPDGAYGDLTFISSGDARGLRVQSAAGPLALFAVHGGVLQTAAEPERASLRVTCRGTTPLRVVTGAGVDLQELERAARVLQRERVHGLAATRARKAAQLERYGTGFEAPAEALARGFAWARQRGDEALVGVPGVGRSVLATCPSTSDADAWCFGTRACSVATGLLVAGNRDPARELLKFLAQVQHPSGGIPAYHPFGGLASEPDAAGTLAFLELAERLLAWTGEHDDLRRLSDAIARALGFLAERGGPAPVEAVLDALEPTADRGAATAVAALRLRAPAPTPRDAEAHAIVEAAAAALRRAPGALHGTGAAPALLHAVAALWGLEPDAPEAALGVRPTLPAGWSGFALRRLRVGKSLLDLEVRRRPQAVVLRVAHLFGPRLVLTAGLHGAAIESTEVDDVTLPGARARFETHDRHEVRFHLRG